MSDDNNNNNNMFIYKALYTNIKLSHRAVQLHYHKITYTHTLENKIKWKVKWKLHRIINNVNIKTLKIMKKTNTQSINIQNIKDYE